jgi:D-alanyl-D-alanine carboxypeptidase/D-alanyl-D-alanine-endopeptidase (penicillin-binding protein 4)
VFLQPGGPALAVLACAATLAFAHQASAQSLPVTVAQALQRAGVQATDHGTVVLPLEPGPALVLHNASTGLNPASTMKLVTTHAVLDLLRPQFRWNTSVHLRGSIQGDVLAGDLVLRGSAELCSGMA